MDPKNAGTKNASTSSTGEALVLPMHCLSRRKEAKSDSRSAGLKFECTQCGKCCTKRDKYAHVYLDEHEMRAMAKLLGIGLRSFRERYTSMDEIGWDELRFEGEACPFLDPASNHCAVYAARPVQCRTFPFWDEMVDANGWTERALAYCEGLGRGPVWPQAEVEAAMREMRDAD